MPLSKVKNSAVQGLSLSSTSTALSIDANGQITKPLQPAFSVHKNNTDQNNIATETAVAVTFSHERFDVNGDFSSNTFTSPVTGKFKLTVNLRLAYLDSAAGYYVTSIKTSNETYRAIFDPDFGQDAVYWTHSVNVLADMDANDTASIEIYQYDGSAQTDVIGNPEYTFFTGYLVC